MALAFVVMTLAACLSIGYHLVYPPAIPWTVLPLMLYSLGMSLAMPSITLLALDLFPRNRGMAASVQGFTQSMFNALLAGLISPMVAGTQLSLAVTAGVAMVLGAACWLNYLRLTRRRACPPANPTLES